MSDNLFISYEESKKDETVLVIGRPGKKSGSIDVLQFFFGEEAKRLYNILVGDSR